MKPKNHIFSILLCVFLSFTHFVLSSDYRVRRRPTKECTVSQFVNHLETDNYHAAFNVVATTTQLEWLTALETAAQHEARKACPHAIISFYNWAKTSVGLEPTLTREWEILQIVHAIQARKVYISDTLRRRSLSF